MLPIETHAISVSSRVYNPDRNLRSINSTLSSLSVVLKAARQGNNPSRINLILHCRRDIYGKTALHEE